MQSITIVGFDHPSFTRVIQGIDNIVRLFSLKYIAVNPPRQDKMFGQYTLTFENRYVTTHDLLPPNYEEILYDAETDPNGIIKRELQVRGVHIDDNVVDYYRAVNLQS